MPVVSSTHTNQISGISLVFGHSAWLTSQALFVPANVVMKTCRLSNNQQRSTVQQQELLFIHTYIHIKFMMTITCTTASVEQALSIEIEVDASPRHEVKYVITKYSACLTVHRLVTALLASRAAEQQTPKTCAFDAHISEHCS